MKSVKFALKILAIGFSIAITSACQSDKDLPAVSPTSSASTAPSTSAEPSASESQGMAMNSCQGNEIEYSWEQFQGAAGTTYRPLVIKNIGSYDCQILNTPEISLFENRAGGLVSQVREQEGIELGFPITIKSLQQIILPIGTPNADNFETNVCLKKTANWILIKISPDAVATDLEVQPWQSCTTAGNGPFFAPIGSQ